MTRIRASLRLLAAGALAIALAGQASAATITVSAIGQGWMTATADNKSFSDNNYLAGNCGASDCHFGEFRNFFEFAIPALDGPILSATLLLDTRYEALQQSPSLMYQVTSLPENFGFGDLGTGTVYGSRTYTVADQYSTAGIGLDAAALAAIYGASGGTFAIGGRVTSSVAFGAAEPDQLVFGRTNAPQALQIITGDALGSSPQFHPALLAGAASVPEPVPAALFGMGMMAMGLLARRWRARAGQRQHRL